MPTVRTRSRIASTTVASFELVAIVIASLTRLVTAATLLCVTVLAPARRELPASAIAFASGGEENGSRTPRPA